MRKIDLHIHTVATVSDSYFEFSLDTFKQYVEEMKLDAVAVTNHDIFDLLQLQQIAGSLSIKVFPGIEVNLDGGHLLVIADHNDLTDFDARCKLVANKIRTNKDVLSWSEFSAIFTNLNKYLLIPHTDKSPEMASSSLSAIKVHSHAGEVDSAKKFFRALKDESKLTPVLFSDLRMKAGLSVFPQRCTFC